MTIVANATEHTDTESPSTSASVTTERTGYPFGFSSSAFAAELRHRETRDLLREVEAAQWLALESANATDGTRDYIEHQITTMLEELERRRRLLQSRANDPLRPQWPAQSSERFRDRIDAVKAAWPIERFCTDLLLLDLQPAGHGKFRARCPLPGHDDKTPSFSVDTVKGLAYCHGCGRGGDVLKLAQYVLNLERFTDAVAALEREGGVK